LTGELSRAKDSLASLETELERERRKTTTSSSSTLSGTDRSAASLVRKYGELYAQTRLDTLESLDRLPELEGLDDLKSKLLFSVIVVSINSFFLFSTGILFGPIQRDKSNQFLIKVEPLS
jgi:Mitochondria-eating protein